jgi:hypothetical protein
MREEPEDPRNALQGLCVRCRELKPAALFRKNAAGSRTAWCESCRVAKAKAWGVDEDLIEFAHFLYTLEEGFKTEAKMVARAHGPAAEKALAGSLHVQDMNRPMRIPHRVSTFVEAYRQDFYRRMGLDAPTLSPAETVVA